ncbi:MAG: hypothetical protein ABI440_15160 [Casimicrobiaceae bacterium]
MHALAEQPQLGRRAGARIGSVPLCREGTAIAAFVGCREERGADENLDGAGRNGSLWRYKQRV